MYHSIMGSPAFHLYYVVWKSEQYMWFNRCLDDKCPANCRIVIVVKSHRKITLNLSSKVTKWGVEAL